MRLRALLAFGVILAALAPFGARAASCPVPYTFVNGTLADGTQVNANFNSIITNTNTLVVAKNTELRLYITLW